MIDLDYSHQYSLFSQRVGGSSLQLVRVVGRAFEVCGERNWQVGEYQIDAVWSLQPGARKIVTVEAACDCAAAERVGKLFLER